MSAHQILLLMSTFGFCCSTVCNWTFIGIAPKNDPVSSSQLMSCLKKCLQASCTSVNVTSSECKMASPSHPLELAVSQVPSRLAGACQDHSCKPGTTCKPRDDGSYSCKKKTELICSDVPPYSVSVYITLRTDGTRSADTLHCSNNFHKMQKCRFLQLSEARKTRNLDMCGDVCVHNTLFTCGGFSYCKVNQDCRLFPHYRNLMDINCVKSDCFDSYRRDCYFV